MNNSRRKQIEAIQNGLDKIKQEIDTKAADEETGEAGSKEELAELEENWSSRIDDLRLDLEEIKENEQEYFDNMPEGLQAGDKGSMAEQAVGYMLDCLNDMEELVEVEETGAFVRLFHKKYDGMIAKLDDAAA
jgi:hypothetical protein